MKDIHRYLTHTTLHSTGALGVVSLFFELGIVLGGPDWVFLNWFCSWLLMYL